MFYLMVAQQVVWVSRQKAVETDFRSLAVVMTRTAAMLLLAALLILVLLPAALGARGA